MRHDGANGKRREASSGIRWCRVADERDAAVTHGSARASVALSSPGRERRGVNGRIDSVAAPGVAPQCCPPRAARGLPRSAPDVDSSAADLWIFLGAAVLAVAMGAWA
jgi:hypothetical protein